MRLISLLLCLLLCACATHPGPAGNGAPGAGPAPIVFPRADNGTRADDAAEVEAGHAPDRVGSGNGTRADNATEVLIGGKPSPGGFEKFVRETGKVLVTIVAFSVGLALIIVTHAPVL